MYFIIALFLTFPVYAAELPSLANQPMATPGSSNQDQVRDSSFRDAMEQSRSQPQPTYVPVDRQEQPSQLNQGGLQRGW